MSRTFDLACKECKKAIWVGQKSGDNGYIYKTAEHLKALDDFFWLHEGHELIFCDDQALDDSYEETEI